MENTKIINIKNILMIFLIMISIISLGTFAWLSYRSNDTAMVLTIGEIDGMLVTLKPYQINSSLNPVTTYDSGIVIDVTANNKKSSSDSFKLFYKIDSIDSALVSTAFKYTITKSTNNGSTYTIVKTGDFSTATSNSELEIYKETIPGNNTTYLYKVYLWIDGNMGDQSSMQGKVFTGELRAKVSYPVSPWGEEPVIDNIASTYVTNQNGVQFSDISSDTNGKGLYLRAGTENDVHPIMYYRGAVTNNNVLFAGFCWKIVRTTSTGGTKLVYNGTPTDGKCTNTTGTETQLAETKAFNSSNNSPADVGYMYGTRYTRTSMSSTNLATSYKYGNGVSWNESSYTLTNTIDTTGNWATDYNTLNNNHYTCFNDSGTCTSVYYVYYTSSSLALYITLTNGKTVENAIDEMLTSSSNTTDSTIKAYLDSWYTANLTSYANYLEDTVWCNDRSISSLGGWNPNGGNTFNNPDHYIRYGAYERAYTTYSPIVTCPSVNDSFTTSNSNGNGKLTNPIGLLTADEVMMAGGKYNTENNSYYLYTNQYYWLGSPYYFNVSYAKEFSVSSSGGLNDAAVNNPYGTRPSVSLKPGATLSGAGTSENPFTVSLS